MIQSVAVQNYKSLYDFSFEPGRFNVIIGANGVGKTNILEAITFAAAANQDKLDYEFLSHRIRVTSPEFMKSAFVKNEENSLIQIIISDVDEYKYILKHDAVDDRKWIDLGRVVEGHSDQLTKMLTNEQYNKLWEQFHNNIRENFKGLAVTNLNKKVFDDIVNKKYKEEFPRLLNEFYSRSSLSDFVIYTPEYSKMRKFEESSQIIPLGLSGEGLFYALKKIISDPNKKSQIETIKENLRLLDWFDDFEIPKNLMSTEYKLAIKDRHLDETLAGFDQRSANEGFMFLLFYLVLFTSKDTPAFFSIDNIETGLNPKLCTKLTEVLVELSQKHQKQVIVTTHNPAVLDGLDLKDDQQRLFVADRNPDGHTRLRRITHKEGRKLKLSEIWTNGFIGGLPDNF